MTKQENAAVIRLMKECESSLGILAMNDADLREYLARKCLPRENAAIINQLPIEQLRRSWLEGAFADFELELLNLDTQSAA